MLRRHLRPLLLLFALLSMQWLAIAHALEHPAAAPEKVCSICVLGIGIDGGAPLPASPTVAHWLDSEAPDEPALAAPARVGLRLARARAPPLLTAA